LDDDDDDDNDDNNDDDDDDNKDKELEIYIMLLLSFVWLIVAVWTNRHHCGINDNTARRRV
jgi:hypothetical protein